MIYVGKIVNTHGIKGELRILSNFKYKNEIFKINNFLYIDNIKYQIRTYRKHKNYDMVTLNDYNNINDVLFLKGKQVYSLREYVKEILVTDTNKKILFLKEFINNIDDNKREIVVGGVFDEN